MIALGCAAFLHVGPARAATQVAAVNANVVKPLTLERLQDLDFGTIALSTGTWGATNVTLSQAGVRTCPAPNLICTGAARPARYKVTGTNKMVVRITTPNVTMRNLSDPTKTLTLVVDAPQQVTLTSSGQPGIDFNIGGRISLSSTTVGGDYVGTFNVTVDYQ